MRTRTARIFIARDGTFGYPSANGKDFALVSLSIICIRHSRIFKVSGIKKILWMSFQSLNDNLKRKRMPLRVICALMTRADIRKKLVFDLPLASFKDKNDVQHISAPV